MCSVSVSATDNHFTHNGCAFYHPRVRQPIVHRDFKLIATIRGEQWGEGSIDRHSGPYETIWIHVAVDEVESITLLRNHTNDAEQHRCKKAQHWCGLITHAL